MTIETRLSQTIPESLPTSSVGRQIFESLKTGKEYRHAFVEEKLRSSIASQIKAIREQRLMTQPELAKAMGKSQSWVSRLEDANQPAPTIPSLLQVADAYDVDLEIRFGSFKDLVNRMDTLSAKSLEVPSFVEEMPDIERELSIKELYTRVMTATAIPPGLEPFLVSWSPPASAGFSTMGMAITGVPNSTTGSWCAGLKIETTLQNVADQFVFSKSDVVGPRSGATVESYV